MSGDAPRPSSEPDAGRPTLTDLHCHFVPGVDDGAPDMPSALFYLRDFVEMGITRVATTPHLPASRIASRYRRGVESGFEELREAAERELPGLELSLGFEVRLDGGADDFTDPGLWLGEERRILVEFPMLLLPEEPVASLEPLLEADLVPVLAHPERYGGLADDYGQVERMRSRGTLFCLNAGSLWGAYGPGPEALAWRMLSEGSADLIGSDHHGRPHRADTLDRVWELLSGADERRAARVLLAENPAAVLEGRDVRPVPALSGPAVESVRTAVAAETVP